MDLLYVVELDVAGDPPGVATERVAQQLLEHTALWLGLDLAAFDTEGSATAPIGRDDETLRTASWRIVGTSETQAVVVTTSQPLLSDTGATFNTETTVLRGPDLCRFRLAMGRRSDLGLLAPTPITFLRRPGVLRQVVEDPTLRCSIHGKRVDGRYDWINGPAAPVLLDGLDEVDRLPLLLVDGQDGDAAKIFCSATAHELVGLAQVCPIGAATLHSMRPLLDAKGVSLPRGGAALVWPSRVARNPTFGADRIQDPKRTLNMLLRLLGPASVSARGTNRLLRAAADAARARDAAELDQALELATAQGDIETEVKTLRTQIQRLTVDLDSALDQAGELEEKWRAARTDAANYQAQFEAVLASRRSNDADGKPLPDLSESNLDAFADRLHEDHDAIVFTPNAIRSWRTSGYPMLSEMQRHLVALAEAADQWRQDGCSTQGVVMDQWFKLTYGLNYAPTDKGLRARKLHEFDFDGLTYVREPHLKLDDHTTPDKVGRIYFALDKDEARFIVDHVGLKLYGLG